MCFLIHHVVLGGDRGDYGSMSVATSAGYPPDINSCIFGFQQCQARMVIFWCAEGGISAFEHAKHARRAGETLPRTPRRISSKCIMNSIKHPPDIPPDIKNKHRDKTSHRTSTGYQTNNDYFKCRAQAGTRGSGRAPYNINLQNYVCLFYSLFSIPSPENTCSLIL